jgi:hypothetical protein
MIGHTANLPYYCFNAEHCPFTILHVLSLFRGGRLTFFVHGFRFSLCGRITSSLDYQPQVIVESLIPLIHDGSSRNHLEAAEGLVAQLEKKNIPCGAP